MNYLIDTLFFYNKKDETQYKNKFKENLEKLGLEDYRFYKSKIFFEKASKNKWTLLCLVVTDSRDILDQLILDEKYLIRRELMVLTPGSKLIKNNWKQGSVTNIVEHVNVQEQYLKEFQEIMIDNNTPAMKYIIDQKSWCKEFIALETEEVIYHNENYPKWNQIHLIGMRMKGMFHYKKDFTEGLIGTKEPNFQANFDRLKGIREFSYKANASLEVNGES